MNISAFSNFYTPRISLSSPKSENDISNIPKFGLKMASPIQQDMIAFHSTPKTVNRVINSQLGRDISHSADFYKLQVAGIFMSILAPLISTEEYPDNIIEHFNVRVKSGDSIGNKSGEVKGEYKKGDMLKGGRRCRKKDEISLNMTDIIGAKAVLVCGTKQNAKKVLELFTNAIKNGQIRLNEIEQKIPKSCIKDDKLAMTCALATDSSLEQMKNASEKRFGKEVHTNYKDDTPSNYSALHFLFDVLLRSPNEKPVWKTIEFQLIGHDVNVYKDLDDILYKLLNGKNVEKKYNPIKQLLQPIILPKSLYDLYKDHNDKYKLELKNEGKKPKSLTYAQFTQGLTEDDLKAIKCPKHVLNMTKEELAMNMTRRDAFNKYRAEVFLSQRLKGAKPNKDRVGYDGNMIVDFLPISDSILPLKYSMNSLYNLKKECDNKADKE